MLVIDFSKVGLKSPQRASKRQEEASPATVATDSTGAPLISPSTVFETLILAIIDRLEKGGEVLIASQWQAAHDAEEILTLALDCGATERELKALVACYLATHSFNPSPQPQRPPGARVYALVHRKHRPPQGNTCTPLQFRILEEVETRFYKSEVVLCRRSVL
jgi:hypothetical protein